MISEDLFQRILLNPKEEGADTLYIVSGFAKATMAHMHLNSLNNEININLLVGMTPASGIERANHIAMQALTSQTSPNVFNCRYSISPPPIHSKLYVWFRSDSPFQAYIGSANYTLTGFIRSQKECMTEINPSEGFDYYQSTLSSTISCIDTEIDSHITVYDERLVPRAEKKEYSPDEKKEAIKTRMSELERVKTSFLANDGTLPEISGLNWGQRSGREPNQAYVRLPASIYNTNFFPAKGIPFILITDDNESFVCTRAQANGKAIHTPHNNSLLGIYFRNRIGVPLGELVKKEDLINYGRVDVDIYKIDDESFYLDFSVE